MNTTIDKIMALADDYARADVECGIPTGGLWRGITHNAYIDAREALRAAIVEALVDAERYRWLRANHRGRIVAIERNSLKGDTILMESELDRSIDAAKEKA